MQFAFEEHGAAARHISDRLQYLDINRIAESSLKVSKAASFTMPDTERVHDGFGVLRNADGVFESGVAVVSLPSVMSNKAFFLCRPPCK